MKINNSLKKYIKGINGKIIAIGINDSNLMKEIENNDKILECDLLNSISNGGNDKTNGKTKKILIRKIRKTYNKKSINYLIININEINKYLKTFIKDSIYLTNKEICYYTNKNYDIEILQKKYKRYTKDINVAKCDDGYIIKINTENVKNNFFKEKIYYFIDTLSDIADMIGDILSS